MIVLWLIRVLCRFRRNALAVYSESDGYAAWLVPDDRAFDEARWQRW